MGARLDIKAPRTARKQHTNGENAMAEYRFNHQTGEAYVYDAREKAYVFCGVLNGRTEAQFIRDRERHAQLDDGEE